MYICTLQTKKFIFGYLQQSASEIFLEPCFEAGKWIAWLYLIWDSIPQGCAWKWEISFKKVSSRIGQSYVSWCGANVGTDKNLFKVRRCKIFVCLNTNTVLLNKSFSLSGSIPKYRRFVSVDKEESDIINFAALLWRDLSLLNKISLQPSQTVYA